MIGLSIGLMPGRTGTGGFILPTYTNFWSNAAADPTITGSSAGRLLVAVANRNSATPATADAGWTLWGTEAHGSAAQSISVYTKVATGTDTITWTNAANLRAVWEFNGAKDTLNGSQGTNATLNYEAQPAMTANSLVGVFVMTTTAQTSIAAATAGLGYTQRGFRNASIAAWAGDSNTTRVSAFDPADGTFDTSGNWTLIVFTIKGFG
jgi:hypothetical protein